MMAEGGEDKDENPYSFKKFIKSKNNCQASSESDTDHSDEDGAVDLLENSCSLSRGGNVYFGSQLTAFLMLAKQCYRRTGQQPHRLRL